MLMLLVWDNTLRATAWISLTVSLEKEMATHASILAWEIHGQKSLAGATVLGVAKVSDPTQ